MVSAQGRVLNPLVLSEKHILLLYNHILGEGKRKLFAFQRDKLSEMNLQVMLLWAAGTEGDFSQEKQSRS